MHKTRYGTKDEIKKFPMQLYYYLEGKLSSPRETPKILNRGLWVTGVFHQETNTGPPHNMQFLLVQ